MYAANETGTPTATPMPGQRASHARSFSARKLMIRPTTTIEITVKPPISGPSVSPTWVSEMWYARSMKETRYWPLPTETKFTSPVASAMCQKLPLPAISFSAAPNPGASTFSALPPRGGSFTLSQQMMAINIPGAPSATEAIRQP